MKRSPLQDGAEIALIELAGDEMDEDAGTEDWINRIDRGGLWHVNDDVYGLFVEMEYGAKKVLRLSNSSSSTGSLRDILLDEIRKKEEVQFKWWLLSSDMDDNVGSFLFNNILDIFVTIRGFAFAFGCIEFFKQSKKIGLQKKTALRKELS